MNADSLFMQRCLQLAEGGVGRTEPNPYVGAVVVRDGVVIGEGFHQKFGGPHAEVFAIESVANKELLKSSTLYVNLEPCSHYGKTPPCAELIIRSGIPRVVVAMFDPNPQVAGRGIEMLKAAGIEVITGVLEQQALWLNRRFVTFHSKKRPYIILKWAQTTDGFIDIDRSNPALANVDNWITGPELKTLVHRWRAQEMAVLIGKNTLLNDNPQLNVREWTGRDPIRLLLTDVLPDEHFRIFTEDSKTLVFNPLVEQETNKASYIKVPFDETMLAVLCEKLHERGILSVIVEGGRHVLETFISAGLWDEARVLTGSKKFGQGLSAPVLGPAKEIENKKFGDDRLQIFIPESK